MDQPHSFLWHDYETFGAISALDRPAQFAAIRTDAELKPLGDPVTWYCAPPDDILPHPGACLITGITPQIARTKGECEADFARHIHDEMMEPGTCAVGYNSIRFDDEVSRFLFYRNFYDAYEREYANGNTRWDLIDLARMFYALRPEGIEWPLRDDGNPSFRLEDLTAANRIAHVGAHDALADVRASIDFARLLRQQQPRLFNWGLGMRDWKPLVEMLDPLQAKPLLHTSGKFHSSRGCTSIVMPLSMMPGRKKSVIVFDLMANPQALIDLDADAIHDRVFTPTADLPDGIERLPLKAVHTNKVPMLAPLAVLRGVDTGRIGLDPERCIANAGRIRESLKTIRYKVMDVFRQDFDTTPRDPDVSLYTGGFFSQQDKRMMTAVRQANPAQLATGTWRFSDPRLPQMLFRYRARNWPDSLSADEQRQWQDDRLARLHQPPDERQLSVESFNSLISEMRAERLDNPVALDILDKLEAWPGELGIGRGPPHGE